MAAKKKTSRKAKADPRHVAYYTDEVDKKLKELELARTRLDAALRLLLTTPDPRIGMNPKLGDPPGYSHYIGLLRFERERRERVHKLENEYRDLLLKLKTSIGESG